MKRKWNRWRLLANTTSLCITHVSHVPVKAKTTTTRSQLTLVWWISIHQSGYTWKLIMHKHRMDRIPSWCATCHQKTQLTMTSRLRCDLDFLLHTHNMSGCTLFQENEKSKTMDWRRHNKHDGECHFQHNIYWTETRVLKWTVKERRRTDGRAFSSPGPVVKRTRRLHWTYMTTTD